ncbi:hypothetical protein AO703_01575 [[Enterobacter] lignolyticus]|uniref:Major facilitator superfamily MFS_1 n=2 Tax=[Enterobacter] lignolyticus TaxID=1334193 RepID=A0A806X381_9ENTR|nr:hypothetical protein AO703_01575 [[Enterobacter] lignolyticus]
MSGELVCSFTAVLLFAIPYNEATYPIIITLGFIISVFSSIHHPVFQALIPELYKEDKIKNVNSQVSMIDSFVSIIAPVSIGVILMGLDKRYLSLLISFIYFISFVTIVMVDYKNKRANSKFGFKIIMVSLHEGINYVAVNKSLRNIAALFFFVNFGIRVVFSNLIWIFAVVYGIHEDKIPLYFITIGLGAIVGAKGATLVIGRYSDVLIISVCTAIIALCSLLFAFAKTPMELSIMLAVSSMVQSIIIVTFFTYRQKITEINILSRVVAVTRLISYLSIPFAALVSGRLLIDSESVLNIYIMSALTIALGLCVFLFFHRKSACRTTKASV